MAAYHLRKNVIKVICLEHIYFNPIIDSIEKDSFGLISPNVLTGVGEAIELLSSILVLDGKWCAIRATNRFASQSSLR